MPIFTEIERIQSYLRNAAYRNYEAVPLPPLTLFFHRSDSFKYFNYAIPDQPCDGDLRPVLAAMRAEFQRRGRIPRFEFFEAFTPGLPAVLIQNGFLEEDRQWSMLCTRQTFQPAPEIPGVEIVILGPASSPSDARDFMIAQREGFDPGETVLPTEAEIQKTLEHFQPGHSFLARVSGQPAGAAVFGPMIDGVSEIAGIATRKDYRRRGIATLLTARACQSAFDLGAQTLCLTAADAAAGRVYERVGFQPFSTMLAYIAADQLEPE